MNPREELLFGQGVDFGPPIVICGHLGLGLIFGSPGVDFGFIRVNLLPLKVAFWHVDGEQGSGSRIVGL